MLLGVGQTANHRAHGTVEKSAQTADRLVEQDLITLYVDKDKVHVKLPHLLTFGEEVLDEHTPFSNGCLTEGLIIQFPLGP